MELRIKEKIIRIYVIGKTSEKMPIIFLNHFGDETKEIYERCQKEMEKSFILVIISNLNWNRDLSPWPEPKVYKNDDDFEGGADTYLKELENDIIPEVLNALREEHGIAPEYLALAGYSLAGLFDIYANYKTSLFKRILSASGSLWYPGFLKFIKESDFISTPDKIYLSLGNKENKTKNELMSKVLDNTLIVKEHYESLGIKTIYEENEGNHFNDPIGRIIKGMKWILE